MRSLEWTNTGIFLLLAGVAAIFCFLYSFPMRPQMWVYPLVRQFTIAKVYYETRDFKGRETAHFIIKYHPQDEAIVELVAESAEAAYAPVTEKLGFIPKGKSLLVIHQDKNELRKAFGWSGSESAMGVYWGGVIQILSPKAWLAADASAEEFIYRGPLLHEFTHLVLDYKTNGNYPRWFTEGLAQYMEYTINGYEWKTVDNSFEGKLYTMEELTEAFDQLPNQGLAYRESLAALRYIQKAYGEQALQGMIIGLSRGQSFTQVLTTHLQLQEGSFETAWQAWARSAMK